MEAGSSYRAVACVCNERFDVSCSEALGSEETPRLRARPATVDDALGALGLGLEPAERSLDQFRGMP